MQTEKNGELIHPSPWLEAIETFYNMAYGASLSNTDLEFLASQNTSNVIHTSKIPMTEATQQPTPILIDDLIPTTISISQYQSLVNCPYQYFALSCLELSPTEDLQEELTKADFGSLVHESIHAFFVDVPSLPGPFTEKVCEHNHIEATELLHIISEKVFSNASHENDFDNQLWLTRWKTLIPRFIDWEIKQQQKNKPIKHEVNVKSNISHSFEAYGRLDRVDHNADGDVVIDYKTGMTTSKKSIVNGEQVQLPMYALLNDQTHATQTTQVEFVKIGEKNTVKSTSVIKADELEQLKKLHLERLQEFIQSMNNKMPFTALANDDTCQRCDAFGICRKPFWTQ